MSKCFVSFSSRDGEFAGKLMASLQLQSVSVWDYSNAAQDIPLGASVKSRLRKRIDESAHFIAVVTAASVDPDTGKFPRFEWQYAHAQGKRILPVTIRPFQLAKPGPDLEFLEDAKYLPFDAHDIDAYDLAFARLCEEMGVPYSPPFLGDPRVIFAPRFEREIRGLAIPPDHRILLRKVIDDFTKHYAAQEWIEAKETAAFFAGACKRFLKGTILYYPTLLLGLCQMHEGRYEDALATIGPLLNHPLADENAWAAMGQIHFLGGEFQKALDMFRIAKEKCPAGEDWEARFNILATCLELGRTEEASAAFSGFDIGSRPVEDQVKIANLQAAVFAQRNYWDGVIGVLQDLFDNKIGNAASAVYLARAYEHSGRVTSAMHILEREAERLKDNNLYHHLAAMHARRRDPLRAIEVYRMRLLNDPDRPTQMMTDYALILRSMGRIAEFQDVCRRAIALPRPRSNSEFYFRGLAHYLLGHEEHARALYVESKSQQEYYSKVA